MSQEKTHGEFQNLIREEFIISVPEKKGFITARDVNKEIHKIKAKEGIKLNYYHCDYCGKYHLTKKYVKTAF